MTKSALINVTEVAEILGTSKSHAYKMARRLNDEVGKQGYIVIAGKVSRAYFEEKIYGLWVANIIMCCSSFQSIANQKRGIYYEQMRRMEISHRAVTRKYINRVSFYP